MARLGEDQYERMQLGNGREAYSQDTKRDGLSSVLFVGNAGHTLESRSAVTWHDGQLLEANDVRETDVFSPLINNRRQGPMMFDTENTDSVVRVASRKEEYELTGLLGLKILDRVRASSSVTD